MEKITELPKWPWLSANTTLINTKKKQTEKSQAPIDLPKWPWPKPGEKN